MLQRILSIFALLGAMCAIGTMPALALDHTCRIAVVKSWDLAEYNVALEDFFETLSKRDIRCETFTHSLDGKSGDVDRMIASVKEFKPDLVLTVGSRATSVVSERLQKTPIVFSMVLYPVASTFVDSMDKPGRNVTGAAMDVPVTLQMDTLKRILPDLERVGVLYSPKETLPVIQEATRVMKSMGIELVAEEVHTDGDVPDALSRLEKQDIDVLWSVADGKVFNRQSTRYIIEQVVRKGIPFMGPHNGFVRAGALLALTADYRENGRQAAELAAQILEGAKPGNIPVRTPRKVEMAINLRVANHIGLKIPQSMIKEASQVFE
ncbi:MAG: hypothetical protein Kow0099_32340 [Candidatus Abyssubacteria bacterium]